ncbi:MAG: NTP transferase domain-containing protein [Paracoccaceae bacterium]|nr:NTP transferase domain-containing protein [Paracoccaceae bacterium]
MYKCVTLILSAGYSTRMRGDDKLLEKIDGISQIYRIAKAAVANGITYITLPAIDHPRERALSGLAVQKIFLNNKNTGIGASIAEGVKYIQDNESNVTGIIVIPADMPLIDCVTIEAFYAAHSKYPGSIIQAADDKGSGHPVLFPGRYFKNLMLLKKEIGGKDIIKKSKNIKILKFSGKIATLDLDTPEDWKNCRNERFD